MSTQVISIVEANEIREMALSTLLSGSQLLNKSYLTKLGNFNLEDSSVLLSPNSDVRIFHVSRIVLGNKQSVLESVTAAYTALGTAGYAVFFLLKSDGQETHLYLGTRGQGGSGLGQEAGDLLEQVINGHFPGSQLTNQNYEQLPQLIDELDDNASAITAVTGIPSLSQDAYEHFIQGLEHFIDAAEGKKYQALILAEPVSPQQLEIIRVGYEQVATQLSPLLKQTLSFSQNESESISLALSQGLSHSLGTSLGLTETKSTSESSSFSYTEGRSSSTTSSKIASGVGAMMGIVGSGVGLFAGGAGGAVIGGSIGSAVGGVIASAFNEQESSSSTHSSSKSFSSSSAYSQTMTETDSTSFTQSQTDSRSLGASRQITLESTDKSIEQLLKRVDHQLERVEEARQYGAWNSAAYFIGENSASSEALASIFLGLIRGVNSSSEDFSLTTWTDSDSIYDSKKEKVIGWLKQLSHPRLHSEEYEKLNIPYLTPATLVSTKEMAIQLGLPRRSTSAVTVIETQAFGRKVQRADHVAETAERAIHLGNVYHLWNEMKHNSIKLSLEQFTSHVFISGSTGSGKSNTVYQLLDQLHQNDVKFMVIEPAKGEYKNVFGHREDVLVLGTNPLQAQMLKINPFKFPEGIHVLEHIDRLVEIFNVCWPMYAAMPAVLKDAMLEAYKTSGWDLDTSCNLFGKALFPTFTDLLTQLEKVIQQSAFSEEVKSNYIGSLVTRVKSLTNGLNGQIFASNEIDNAQLFDSNVIVDLSRIGSQETKSLIMGILVMRLSEHRMSDATGMNQPLKHVTVLEEAHNILKRTSTEQSSEGSNVAGKAVEMLSNAIAEMRTYGEGFIIADQSPSAVDISAIRNTNTKIIMRLPDETDRRLAGKAAGVTDEQLEEIAKLPKGVAVVYQNDWLEPVLCKIHHFGEEEKPYQYEPQNQLSDEKKAFYQHIADLLFSQKTKKQLDLVEISKSIEQSKLGVEYKNYFLEVINRLEQNTIPPILEKDDNYLVDLYQRIIQQQIELVQKDLSVELQQHLANIS
ncbi:ATP-binding protein [Haemophilus sp. C1]|uniref:ATP-binding protein n=1 Tax=Haemophilus sp. C1 TaxID=1661745 RepID=UPI0006ABDCC0|nr:ATP-binding protein [Haemophilus sp. C1]